MPLMPLRSSSPPPRSSSPTVAGVTDSGEADPRLARSLRSYDGSAASQANVLAALADARIFVAITATATGVETAAETGLRAESSAEMALVSILNAAGERAVPAFADTASLKRWRLDVRPVAVTATYLARAALDDGASAVLLDPAAKAVLLERTALAALADGFLPVPGSSLATRIASDDFSPPTSPPPPDLVAALASALAPERLAAARLLDGPAGPVLGVAPRRPLDAPALAALAQRVGD